MQTSTLIEKLKLKSIQPIEDKHKKATALCKRKKGILKKAIELEKLCDVNLCLIMFDRKGREIINY